MGFFRRWSRKWQKEERYVNFFWSCFWSSVILATGWGMLRLADSKSIYGIDWQHTLSGGEQDHGADSCQVSSYSSIKDSLVLVGNREGNSEQILVNKAFVTSYNKDTRNPNWSSWKLTSEHTDGIYSRDNESFFEDERVVTPRAVPSDYRGSGYDRGHMCPAADNRWDKTAMHESFAMTNVCPQDRDLNKNTWNEIEQLCRRWAREYGVIYIVCGPLYYNHQVKSIGMNKIVVPDGFFKVVLRTGNEPYGIGFICDNQSDEEREVLHVTTIKMIEDITGYSFWKSLPDSLSNEVKGNSNIANWRGTIKFIKQHSL